MNRDDLIRFGADIQKKYNMKDGFIIANVFDPVTIIRFHLPGINNDPIIQLENYITPDKRVRIRCGYSHILNILFIKECNVKESG